MQTSVIFKNDSVPRHKQSSQVDPALKVVAIRTAFIARFIVLREGRRSRAHRAIEKLTWNVNTSSNELAERIRQTFVDNGDKLEPVNRDISRALRHAERSAVYFIQEYLDRATLNFAQALLDYEKSNKMLFGEDNINGPRKGGWRLETLTETNEENGE
jgi:hypothetical protein